MRTAWVNWIWSASIPDLANSSATRSCRPSQAPVIITPTPAFSISSAVGMIGMSMVWS